jgi:hypothetical protein
VPRFILIAAYVAWPAGVLAVRLMTPVRLRCLLVAAAGWLAALAVGTTGTPALRALPGGLVAGAGLGLALQLMVARGVTFEWDPGRTYDVYDGKIPVGEWVVLGLAGVAGLVGLTGLLWS